MRKNRIRIYLIILLSFIGIMEVMVGRGLYGAIFLVAAFGMWYTMGGIGSGSFDPYQRKVRSQFLTLDRLYDMIRDIKTPIGGFSLSSGGDEICLGNGRYGDHITIRNSGKFIELRCESDSGGSNWETITPADYSEFAADKVMTSVIMDDLAKLILDINSGSDDIPDIIGKYKLYHYNSSDYTVRDPEGNEYAVCESLYDPLSVSISDMDGNRLAEVTRGLSDRKNAFSVRLYDEEYGAIRRDTSGSSDVFRLSCEDGNWTATAFPAIMRGKLSCNYILELDGVRKAALAGSARIEFKEEGLVGNDIILSMDDDYLLVYLVIQETIMAASKFLK